ncbi:hypothetical protein [Nocardioides sp.]|uniref:hypothetical protein n=1 Tax=Nocardioides sp. TaxID=35761 RepID=UPI0035152467
MTTEPDGLGNVIDSLEVPHSHHDGDLYAGAIVILKVIDSDGDVVMRVAHSDGVSWFERIGMLTVALEVERNPRGDDD